MNFLFDLLMEVIGHFVPGHRNHDNRSIIGESKLDRSAKHWTIIGMILLLAAAAGVWWWLG